MEPPDTFDKYKDLRLAVCCIVFILICIGILMMPKLLRSEDRGHIAYSRLFLQAPTNPDISISIIIGKLIECESGGNPLAWNHDDPNDGSKGILQFQDLTFKNYCVDKYGLKNDIWDSGVQINCAAEMLRADLGHNWTCYDPKMSI